jgi:DNA invertase Pin-like site-specific DNA recombinase
MKYNNMKYVAYYRVSTQKQGSSGLGLSDQEKTVKEFISNKGELLSAFTEIESGRKNDRLILLQALEYAKQNNAVLIVARLDRLSRDWGFTMNLHTSGVDFVCCDMPDLNTLNIGILASVNQYQSERIRKDTKSAFEQGKRNGKVYGNPQNFTNETRKTGREVYKNLQQSNQDNKKAFAIISMMEGNKCSLRTIATFLNTNGFKTSRGSIFYANSIKQIQKLYQQ